MKICLALAIGLLLGISGLAHGQRGDRNRGNVTDAPDHPQAVGEAGIAWYSTWETGLAEAKRSNRPIFFMSAATTCKGISGVF